MLVSVGLRLDQSPQIFLMRQHRVCRLLSSEQYLRPMTREEFRAMVREEVQSILKEEFRNMLKRELKAPEDHPDRYGRTWEHGEPEYLSRRRELNRDLHYLESIEQSLDDLKEFIVRVEGYVRSVSKSVDNVADAMWPGHKRQWLGNITRPDTLLAYLKKERHAIRSDEDKKYKDIRLSNFDKAIEYFKDDPKELIDWIKHWSMCPYPERPWSGEPYVDLGPDTPAVNAPWFHESNDPPESDPEWWEPNPDE